MFKIFVLEIAGINSYYSRLLETVDTIEQTIDKIAELNAMGFNAYYIESIN